MDTLLSNIYYATRFVKLDRKSYYLPHTRIRGYMICVDILQYTNNKVPTEKDANRKCREAKEPTKLLEKWVDTVKLLQRPASAPVDSFLLDSDDPIFDSSTLDWGAELEKAKKSAAWEECKCGHHNYQHALGLGMQKKSTNWVNDGSFVLPDYYHNNVKGFSERILDTLEVAHLRNLARGFDDRYYKYIPFSVLKVK